MIGDGVFFESVDVFLRGEVVEIPVAVAVDDAVAERLGLGEQEVELEMELSGGAELQNRGLKFGIGRPDLHASDAGRVDGIDIMLRLGGGDNQ